jgi:hypothetical protein
MNANRGASRLRLPAILCTSFALLGGCADSDPLRAASPAPPAPDTRITSGPPAITNAPAATFELASNAAAAVFQCAVDDAAFVRCSSPYRVTVEDGDHTLQVRALVGGSADPTAASYAWRVDTRPPAAVVTAAPPAFDNQLEPRFEFRADPDAMVTCAIDRGAPAPCTSPYQAAALAEGPHTLDVVATDAAGNASAVHYAWTIDLRTAPLITSGPVSPTRDATPGFAFSLPRTRPPTQVECRVVTAAALAEFAACTSPYTAPALPDGDATFELRTTDASGAQQLEQLAFTVDTTPPAVVITSGPGEVVYDFAVEFAFTAPEPAAFTCSIGGPFVACQSPMRLPVADSVETFHVRAVDAAGNTAEASQQFRVDLGPPHISLAGPSGSTSEVEPSFTFSADRPATFECSLGGDEVDLDIQPCSSPLTLGPLAPGDYEFTVLATSPANFADHSLEFTVEPPPAPPVRR